MTKGVNIFRCGAYFACSFIIVYLVWIGARYVFTNNVVFDVVDGFGVITISWFATRDIVNIDDKLRLTSQFSKQHM